MACKNLCLRVKEQFKHVSSKRKVFDYFSCNTCYLFFNITEHNHLYEKHPELEKVIGKEKFNRLITSRQNNCFCCGRRFSVRSRGSYYKRKIILLEQIGKIKRIE